jgi:hypothetical protein
MPFGSGDTARTCHTVESLPVEQYSWLVRTLFDDMAQVLLDASAAPFKLLKIDG